MSIKDYYKQVIIKYNGKRYKLEKDDIPGLGGYGKIVIVNKPGKQVQEINGCFMNMDVCQSGYSIYINGVNLDELVKRLEERKKQIKFIILFCYIH